MSGRPRPRALSRRRFLLGVARSNAAMPAIIDALRDVGVQSGDRQTRGPQLHPTDRGYAGNHEVAVTVRDLATLGATIDAAVAAGGPDVTMHGVSFGVDEPELHLPAVRAAAMRAVHSVATQLAEAGGAEVGEVVTISERRGGPGPVAMRAEARGVGTPVEAGGVELRLEVDATYRLVDPS